MIKKGNFGNPCWKDKYFFLRECWKDKLKYNIYLVLVEQVRLIFINEILITTTIIFQLVISFPPL